MARDTDRGPHPLDYADDQALGDPGVWRWVRPATSIVVLLLLLGGPTYAYLITGEEVLYPPLVWDRLDVLDWMYALALAFVGVQFVVPAVRAPDHTRWLLRRFARNRFALVCLAVLLAVSVAGTLIPILLARPTVDPQYLYQPPAWAGVDDRFPIDCAGEVVDGRCLGTTGYLLGSDEVGKDVLLVTLFGINTSLKVGVTATVLVVAIGATVGTVAGYLGGRVDEVLMRYVDVQQAVPAFFVYILVGTIFVRTDLVLMVVVFGLLSWGGLARLVRSDVLGQRDAAYVRAAEGAGGGTLHVVRRHLLPNASGTVVTAATLTAPKFVLYEAALSYLEFGDEVPTVISLGGEIADGLDQQFAAWWEVWWVWLVPAFALGAIVLTANVVGDALRDVLDPRTSQ